MNKQRRKRIEEVIGNLRVAYDELELIKEEEEEAYDNMPEDIQSSERGDEMQEYIITMDTALSDLDSVINDLSESFE